MIKVSFAAALGCVLLVSCSSGVEQPMPVGLPGPSQSSESPQPRVSMPAADPAHAALALADEFLSAWFERYPEGPTYYSLPGYDHARWTDNSPAAFADWRAREDAWLVRLSEIDLSGQVGSMAWAAYGIMHNELQASVVRRICRTELWNVSQADGWQTFMPYVSELQPIATAGEREAALSRARQLTQFVEVEIANLIDGLKQGYRAPRRSVQIVIDEISGLMSDGSPFSSPVQRTDDKAFAEAYQAALDESVMPALVRYREFLQQTYLPAARDEIAVTHNPDGERCYLASIRYFSTLNQSPEQIHQIGLKQIAQIRQEMQHIGQRSFDTDDVDALLQRVTRDPAYAFETREQIIDYGKAALARARAAAPEWFGILPKADVVLQTYPAYREASGTGEYQSSSDDGTRPGIYFIPTRDPQTRPRAGQESLAYHETIPGHHLQGAISLELKQAHPVVRYFWSSGFGEGWALYSERLADEMGLYGNDLDRLGMLGDQAARAARLVIDTGIHAFGWSRERALAYMLKHTTWPASDVESEIDRYIVWPGQATAYMLGMQEILRLRALAQARMGERFDIRQFHDQVLGSGNLTLPMLADKIDHWLRSNAPP